MDKILGIDLGTTNSCMALLENGKAKIIPNAEGERTTPSVILFEDNDELAVGNFAKKKAVAESDKTVESIKRKMGSKEKIKSGNYIAP